MEHDRIYNFSAGPAVLPVEVLEIVKENILNYNKSGMGVMELSHRSPEFTEIIESAEANLRELLSIGSDYSVLFCTGGASTQFSMVPMNLKGGGEGPCSYIVTGSWSKKALAEAKRFSETHVCGSSEDKNFSYLPGTLDIPQNAAYVHFTSNNTIFGTQYSEEPDTNGAPLICDASSDFLHKKLDIDKYGLIYAGAQKNLGPAGVSIIIVRKDLLERVPADLPKMLDYKTYVDANSLYNTPPTFPIYVVGEVFKWLKANGGLEKMAGRNKEKADILYNFIDESEFYRGTAEKDSRSLMNVCFRLKNEDLEAEFIKVAKESGFNGLKGHRSVGGVRASIYNAFPKRGVEDLVKFMAQFSEAHG